jgi:uncharacterized protein YjiS (DUF1127 family)
MTSTPFLERRPACVAVRSRRSALDDLSDAAQWVLATVREWGRRSREREQVSNMDERMLKDIGITRAEALRLSSKPFWRE